MLIVAFKHFGWLCVAFSRIFIAQWIGYHLLRKKTTHQHSYTLRYIPISLYECVYVELSGVL